MVRYGTIVIDEVMFAVKNALLLSVVFLTICFALVGCGGGGGASGATGAYGSISGTVFVPGSKSGSVAAADRGTTPSGYSPLAGATVSATVGSVVRTATTDLDGKFEVTNVPVGTASIRIVPPSGESFREFSSNFKVSADATTKIGVNGNISLLSATASALDVTVDSVDTSAWPTVRAHVSVLDPDESAALIGLSSADFAFTVNGEKMSISSIETETSAGAGSHLAYVLSATASGTNPGYARAEIDAIFSDRTGSASQYSSRPTVFVSPIYGSTVSFAFKDANYVTGHPGKWHMGVDLATSINTRVNAVAKGQVTAIIVEGQNTSVVVEHHLSSAIATADGSSSEIYAIYGCITPSVGVGDTVEPGQLIGRLRGHTEGSHLHLGVRVGEGITSAWDGNLVDGAIPAADAYGLTDGWANPTVFLAAHTPDNDWIP